MKTNINIGLLLVASAFMFASCNNTTEKTESSVDSVKKVEVPAVVEEPAKEPTKIKFTESEFDFGKINEGQKVEHVFKFTNAGDKTLFITDARASCGCTIPEFTKDPVEPGKDGQIKVIYDSKNKEGKIEKTVTVTANTEPVTTDLKIKVEVIKKIEGPFNKK